MYARFPVFLVAAFIVLGAAIHGLIFNTEEVYMLGGVLVVMIEISIIAGALFVIYWTLTHRMMIDIRDDEVKDADRKIRSS